MSRTKKHVEKGKYNNGIIDYESTSISFKNSCKRWNFSRDEERQEYTNLKQKTFDKLNPI